MQRKPDSDIFPATPSRRRKNTSIRFLTMDAGNRIHPKQATPASFLCRRLPIFCSPSFIWNISVPVFKEMEKYKRTFPDMHPFFCNYSQNKCKKGDAVLGLR
jgi:hypothetical protein